MSKAELVHSIGTVTRAQMQKAQRQIDGCFAKASGKMQEAHQELVEAAHVLKWVFEVEGWRAFGYKSQTAYVKDRYKNAGGQYRNARTAMLLLAKGLDEATIKQIKLSNLRGVDRLARANRFDGDWVGKASTSEYGQFMHDVAVEFGEAPGTEDAIGSRKLYGPRCDLREGWDLTILVAAAVMGIALPSEAILMACNEFLQAPANEAGESRLAVYNRLKKGEGVDKEKE